MLADDKSRIIHEQAATHRSAPMEKSFGKNVNHNPTRKRGIYRKTPRLRIGLG